MAASSAFFEDKEAKKKKEADRKKRHNKSCPYWVPAKKEKKIDNKEACLLIVGLDHLG